MWLILLAVAAATKAYAGVKAFIEAGKSIEDTFTVVARWQGHASDVLYASQRHQKRTNPFKQLVFASSVEAEAAELLHIENGLIINVKSLSSFCATLMEMRV